VHSHYILLSPPAAVPSLLELLPAEEDDGRVTRTVERYDPLPPGQAIIWTDDRHAALDALDLMRYLKGH